MKLERLIVVLSIILVCLLIAAYVVFRLGYPSSEEYPRTTQATDVSSSADTEPSTQLPTQPSMQLPTEPSTQAPTQPITKPVDKIYSENPTVNAFISARMDKWICPVKDSFGEVVGSRTFASSRGGGARAHAGLDFVAPHGTKVYAVTSGTVQRVAVFYQNTWAVEVLNDDGSILRYCEIATDLKAGDYVRQGDVIGTILRAEKGLTEMLHMEVYFGNGEGALTQSGNTTYQYVAKKNYMRRSDLLDPTFLKDLPKSRN